MGQRGGGENEFSSSQEEAEENIEAWQRRPGTRRVSSKSAVVRIAECHLQGWDAHRSF